MLLNWPPMTIAAITPPLSLDFFLGLVFVIASTESYVAFSVSSPINISCPIEVTATNSIAKTVVNIDLKKEAWDGRREGCAEGLVVVDECISNTPVGFFSLPLFYMTEEMEVLRSCRMLMSTSSAVWVGFRTHVKSDCFGKVGVWRASVNVSLHVAKFTALTRF